MVLSLAVIVLYITVPTISLLYPHPDCLLIAMEHMFYFTAANFINKYTLSFGSELEEI